MNEDQADINVYMRTTAKPIPITIVPRLKFKNQIFAAGDNIALLHNMNSTHLSKNTVSPLANPVLTTPITANTHYFGKILLIGRVPITQFPVLLIAWYYSKSDPIVQQQSLAWLGRKELLLSGWTDWQYVESIVGKINVLTIQEWESIDIYEREEANMYYCRAVMKSNADTEQQQDNTCIQIGPTPPSICHCLSPFNPDQMVVSCTLCGLRFHPSCAENEEICLLCQ